MFAMYNKLRDNIMNEEKLKNFSSDLDKIRVSRFTTQVQYKNGSISRSNQ